MITVTTVISLYSHKFAEQRPLGRPQYLWGGRVHIKMHTILHISWVSPEICSTQNCLAEKMNHFYMWKFEKIIPLLCMLCTISKVCWMPVSKFNVTNSSITTSPGAYSEWIPINGLQSSKAPFSTSQNVSLLTAMFSEQTTGDTHTVCIDIKWPTLTKHCLKYSFTHLKLYINISPGKKKKWPPSSYSNKRWQFINEKQNNSNGHKGWFKFCIQNR